MDDPMDLSSSGIKFPADEFGHILLPRVRRCVEVDCDIFCLDGCAGVCKDSCYNDSVKC